MNIHVAGLFFHDLKSEAVTKAHLFLQNQVDAQTMQSIYLNNKKFINEVEVAVYSIDFRMLYHDAIQNDIIKEDHAMVDRILKRKKWNFLLASIRLSGCSIRLEEKIISDRCCFTTDMVMVICLNCRRHCLSCLL